MDPVICRIPGILGPPWMNSPIAHEGFPESACASIKSDTHRRHPQSQPEGARCRRFPDGSYITCSLPTPVSALSCTLPVFGYLLAVTWWDTKKGRVICLRKAADLGHMNENFSSNAPRWNSPCVDQVINGTYTEAQRAGSVSPRIEELFYSISHTPSSQEIRSRIGIGGRALCGKSETSSSVTLLCGTVQYLLSMALFLASIVHPLNRGF